MFFIVIHTVIATGARVAGIIQLAHLLHGQEREVFGDQAYWKEADRQVFTARRASSDQLRPSQGLSINHKAVARIMHDNGLQVRPLARFVRTTDSDHESPRSSPGLEHAQIALSPTLLAAIAG
jgi:transposase InsO family protein